ncbi:DUF1818 family protein [Candidatus Cyanaurora vandensis]|uniref:DUF1818 family protein n=1 Tax=Candidatus Cyanaurora vandensis TaxID=2714958 RepID=UPI0025805784|nr:DUF1818 family protein [Candidatus Cyanaurora vandensis]
MQWQRGNLVRGPSWCVGLNPEELRDLRDQARYLVKLLAEAPTWLMDSETLQVEAQSPTLELNLSGEPQQFTLRLRLYYGREFEGEWLPAVALEVLTQLAEG